MKIAVVMHNFRPFIGLQKQGFRIRCTLKMAAEKTAVIHGYLVCQISHQHRLRIAICGIRKSCSHKKIEHCLIVRAPLPPLRAFPPSHARRFAFICAQTMSSDLAKWVDSTISSDSECEEGSPVGGSTTAATIGGIATFAFEKDVDDWVLCYKHGTDGWRLYPSIIPVSSPPSSDTAVGDTQRTQAGVSFTLEGKISSYPEGSAARSIFLSSFVSDLEMALGVDASRFTVTGMRGGSVVVDFTINPTGSLADSSVMEILASLDEQISDESSALHTGNVTSAAKSLDYTTSMVVDSNSTDPSASLMGISVMEYQEKGLFGFTAVAWYTTEASGTVTLTVQRSHGTKGIIDIAYNTSDGSASGGDDYEISAGTVRFYDGDATKTIDVSLVDDVETEAHFESFTVSLSLQGPIKEGAALRTAATEATIFLYDYGDGVALANATFSATNAALSSLPATDRNASSAEDASAFGWTVTDNGGHGGWVDLNGFAATDAVFGPDEYGGWLVTTV